MLLSSQVSAQTGEPLVSNHMPKRFANTEQATRYALVYRIVTAWGPHVQRTRGENIHQWADWLVPKFRQADTKALQAAASAPTLELMLKALDSGSASTRTTSIVTPKSVGTPTGNMVYTPVTPCNIVDTRTPGGGGAFVAGQPREFHDWSAYEEPSGEVSPCGVPSNPGAVLIGITAVDAPKRGWFQVWIVGARPPVSSSMSFGSTQNTRNDIVLNASNGVRDGGDSFSVMSNVSGVHAVITVLGYFSRPQLACTTFTTVGAVTPSGEKLVVPEACPSGTTRTGIYCPSAGGDVYLKGFDDSGCVWKNNHPSETAVVSAKSRCC
jgi:hypothetical protein